MLTSGFFNSVNGDRKYNAQNMTEYFEGLFSSGVVGNPTTSMQVQALLTPAMAVQVLAGKAFIDGYWAKNDGAVQLPIEAANVAVPRIDAIVLRLNLNEAARNITFHVITGTASDTPTAPDITRTDTIKDYLLATVYVGAGVTAINSGDITDQRASTDCGYVIVVGSDGDPAVINTIANGMYMATGTNDNIALSNLIQNFLTGGDDYKQLEIDVYGELGITNPAKTSSGTVTWFNFASASKTTRRVKLDFSHTTRISITAQASVKNVMFDTTNSNVEIANLQAAMYQTPNGSIFSGTSNPTVTESAFWLNGTGSETLIGAYQGTFLDSRMSVTNNTGAAYGFSGNGNVLRLTNVEAIAMNATGSSNESVGVHVMGNQTSNVLLMTNCTCPLVTRSGYKQDNVVKVNSGYYSLVGNTLGKAASLYSTGTGKTEIGTIYYTGGGKTTIDTDATLVMEGIPADAKATGDQLSDLNDAFRSEANNVNGQIVDVVALNGSHTNETSNGVTFAWSQDGKTCHASGTSFANSNGINNIWGQSAIFPPALLNRKPLFYVESTNPDHLYGQVYWYIGGSIQPERIDLKNGFTQVEIPSTAGGFALRIIADKGGIAYNDDISIRLVLGEQSYIPSFGISSIDMKAAIENTLAAFGECHLGQGVFGVSGIEMPEGSVLYGCGEKTEIRLQGSSAGSAIKMASRCTVHDLMIAGSNADITLNTTVGNRHGILWQGNYANEYGEGSADRKENQPSNGTIYNVSIKRFTGGGITCDNTGPAVNHGLNVTNVKIENCNAGINVAYYSEFHRFTNVMAYLCQYACVNNGGNNVFVNCGFSNSKVGIITKMVDGSTIIDRNTGNTKTRPTTNNTHGSAIGCVFNHMDRDDVTLGTGDAVHLEATDNGFFFDSCQFFYGSIYLEDSKAISFTNCLFGSNKNDQGTSVGYAIGLKNTDATNRKTFFNGCIFSRQPVFTIQNTGSGIVAPIINASYTHGGSVITAG